MVFYSNDMMQWDIYSKTLKKLNLSRNDKILDAGCGRGLLADYLKGFDISGFDFNEKSVQRAKNKGYKKLCVADIQKKLPFKNKEFDKTISIEVFQYLKDPKKSFKELLRITKKQLIITVPNYNCVGLRSILIKKYRKRFFETLNKTYFPTNKDFLIDLSKDFGIKPKIKYISCRFGIIRNLLGDFFSSEVIGIYDLKKS